MNLCQNCGKPADNFYDGNISHKNYEPENTMWLCDDCYEIAMDADKNICENHAQDIEQHRHYGPMGGK